MGKAVVFVLLAIVATVRSDQPLIVRQCTSSNSPIMEITQPVSISPDRIPIPGDLTASVSVRVNRVAPATGLELDVHIQRYVGFLWITVPCISDVGSCKYDACDLLSKFRDTSCPTQLASNNIPCTCETIQPGDYSMTDERFQIPKLDGLWSWLASGDYKVDMKINDKATNTEVACLHVEATIVDPTACDGFLCSIFG